MLSRVGRFLLLAVLPAVLATACGSGSKATSTTTTTTIKDTSAPSAQSGHYRAGERCSKSQSFAYSAQRFTCVNGRLRHKTQDAPPATVHHHSNTSTGARGTQGYLPGY
jgi:hypothetical protein